jgi:hypothetical protein
VLDKVQALAILANDISTSEALHLEIDEAHDSDLNAYLDEAVVANDLLPPICFRRTLKDIQVDHELPSLPSTPNDWYQGSTDGVHVGIDITSLEKKLKNIKRGVKHTQLFWEIREVLTLSGIPPELTEYRILLLPGTRPFQQKGYRLDTSQSLKDLLAKIEVLKRGRQLSAQNLEATQRRMKVVYDQCLGKRKLLPDMWVIIQSAGAVPLTKLKMSWISPYVIKEVFFTRMSKQTSYGKIYRLDICFVQTCTDIVQTSARVRDYPADAFLPADGFLPSAPTVKNASARTRPCIRTDIGASARTSSSPCPRPPSVPPRSPCTDGLLRPRECSPSVRIREKKNFKN